MSEHAHNDPCNDVMFTTLLKNLVERIGEAKLCPACSATVLAKTVVLLGQNHPDETLDILIGAYVEHHGVVVHVTVLEDPDAQQERPH